MNSIAAEWRPGPSVCRCCLTEGCYKDISTEYFWMGRREVYAEMLTETFDLTIEYSKVPGPNSNSRLICEACIARLRDAAGFKRQVRECERTFHQHLALDPSSSAVTLEGLLDAAAEPPGGKSLKLEPRGHVAVKVERPPSDDFDAIDDVSDFGDDDDDDDDLDDQPLQRLATRTPKKEALDFTDLLDNAKGAVKRKSTASKGKTSPGKRAKQSAKKEKATAAAAAKPPKPAKKKKEEWYDPARSNAETLLRCTTAYPFRVNDKCILCVYCQDLYEDPDVFRGHMDEEHSTFSIKVAFHNLPKLEFIKADLTNLKCRLCSKPFDSLETVAEHLKQEHGQRIDSNGKLGVMPYNLRKDAFCCAVCGKTLPSLFHLNRHTITHFLSYVCHVCGNSYVATTGLLRHVRLKHQNYEVSCRLCKRVFPSMEAKEKHRRTEKSCMPYICGKCPERFLDFKSRKHHMETEHGVTRKTFRCGDCDVSFATGVAYYDHFRLHHSDDCAVCKHCGLKFTCMSRMKRHLAKHLT